jgi:hypothetical protein
MSDQTPACGSDPGTRAPEQRIINTYDQLRAAGGGVAICYHPAESRACRPAGWGVIRVHRGKLVITDPHAHWSEHGIKTFTCYNRQTKIDARLNAIAWVKAQGWYAGPWVGNRLRDYVPAEINTRFPIPRRDR